MNLVALIESHEHVCYRYRIAAFTAALRARGWSFSAWPLERGLWARSRQLQRVREADVVLLQRKLLPFWQLALLRRAARVLLYDFDDAVFLRDSNANKSANSPMRLLQFWTTLQAADGIAAGNHFLLQQASRYLDRARITWLPTCVNPHFYKPVSHQTHRDRPFRLGWIGSRSTLPSLLELADGLQAAAKRLAELELWVICDRFPELPGVRVVQCPWSQATEAVHLAQVNAGVSFLPHHPWSDGKCGLKVLQYQAAGLPTIANRRGIHPTLLGEQRTGLFADTPQEFAEAVERLAGDAHLRQQLGWQGRKQLEADYSAELWAERFADWIEAEHARATGSLPRVEWEPRQVEPVAMEESLSRPATPPSAAPAEATEVAVVESS